MGKLHQRHGIPPVRNYQRHLVHHHSQHTSRRFSQVAKIQSGQTGYFSTTFSTTFCYRVWTWVWIAQPISSSIRDIYFKGISRRRLDKRRPFRDTGIARVEGSSTQQLVPLSTLLFAMYYTSPSLRRFPIIGPLWIKIESRSVELKFGQSES